MMQVPPGPPSDDGRLPKILPGQEAILAEALQPIGQEPQGPPPPLILGGQPRLPPMSLPPMGEDSPPALEMMKTGMQPPEALPPMEVPPMLPRDPAAAAHLLESIPVYLKNQLERHDYQRQLDVAWAINEGPAKAEALRTRMLMEPDAPDLDSEIEKAAPFMPKSTTERLRSSRKRTKVLSSETGSFDKELEEKLRSSFAESVVARGREKELSSLNVEIERAKARLTELTAEDGGSPGLSGSTRAFERAMRDPKFRDRKMSGSDDAEIAEVGNRLNELVAKRDALTSGHLEIGDVGRGLKSAFTNEGNVGESMFAEAKRMIEERVGPYEHGYPGPKIANPMTEAGAIQEAMLKGTKPELPEGVTPKMYRAALSEQAARTINRIKGVTTAKDFVTAASATVPWMIAGAGEIGVSAKVADAVIGSSKLLQAAPKLAKVVHVGLTYVAGPALAEAGIAAAQPLPPSAQNQVDQIEDPKLRDATEGAYRMLQVTQAAATSTLFSMSDVLRTFAGGGSLGKMAQRYVEKSSIGKMIGSTIGIAALAPALSDASNIALEEVAAATRSGDVTTSDVLADMAAAKNPALFGAARRFISDPSLETAKEYVLEAAPMAVGIGAIHAMSFAGAKFSSRGEMMAANRAAEADVDKMVEKGDLPEDVANVVKQKLRQETEQMAPTHAEDERRTRKEAIHEALGQEGGEARIMAEKAAEDLLPDLPGKSVREKLQAAAEAHEKAPDDPAAQRDLEIAMRLEEAAAAQDRHEAALSLGEARRMRETPENPTMPESGPDIADRALREVLEHDERSTLRPQELNAVERRLADEAGREWEVVHRDRDSGELSLRSVDTGERIVVPERDLGQYRLAGGEEAPQHATRNTRATHADAQNAQNAQNVPQVRDDLYDTAVSLIDDKGLASQTQVGKALGVGKRRASAIFQELEAGGVVRREGKKWVVVPPEQRQKGGLAMSESEARQVDLERIGAASEALVDRLAAEFEGKGTSLEGESIRGELGQHIVDWGDIARPDDPEAGSAAIAAQLLRRLPEALQTDETITGVMGLPKEAIPMVRAAMQDPAAQEAAHAGMTRGASPIEPGGEPLIDTRLAAKEPVLAPLSESVRRAFGDGDAEAAFAAWSRDNPGSTVETHAEFVAGEQAEVDGISKRLLSGKKEQRDEALAHLSERFRDLELQDEGTALLSLTPEGRKVIQRLNDLRDAIFVGGAIPDHLLAPVGGGAIPKAPGRRSSDEAWAAAAREIADLHARKPRPLDKMFGRNPTPEQVEQHKALMRDWSRDDRAARKRLKDAQQQSRESGSAYVPNFLGAGFQILVSAGKRAWMWLTTARKTMASLFAKFRALAARNILVGAATGAAVGHQVGGTLGSIGGAIVGSGAIPRTYRMLKSVGGNKRRAAHDLKELRIWNATVAADSLGEILGGKDRGAKPASGIVDFLSMWRETDAALMVERAAKGQAVVDELFQRYTDLFPEDGKDDKLMPVWLEKPDKRAEIEAGWKPEQIETAKAMHEFWRSMQDLQSKRLLPDQIIREKEYLPHLRTVRKRLEVARDALRPMLEEALKARDALEKPKRGSPASEEYTAAKNRVDQIRRAVKKFDKDIAGVGKDMAKIHGELEQIARDWGHPDYAPHVSSEDPHAKGPTDWGSMLQRLHEARESLVERAKDWVHQSVPQRLRSGHWKRRKGSLEAQGKRDPSYARSMFHYLRELYRLAPAAAWYESNRERIFGKMRPLTNEEVDRGWVQPGTESKTGYRSRRVEWLDFGRGKGVRANQHVRLGGSVYSLAFDGPKGQKREVHFRTYGDLVRAKEMDPKALGLDDSWTLSEDQVFGHRVLLLPDKSTESSPEQRIRPMETEIREQGPDVDNDGDEGPDEVNVDETTKQLHLPTFSKLHWPSEVYGRMSTREPGKVHHIFADSGPKSRDAYEAYVQHVLDTATGKNILTAAQRITSVFASLKRHLTLGIMSPYSAIKEITDTTAANSIRLGIDNAWEGATWSMEFSDRLHRGIHEIDRGGLAKWLKEHTLRDVGGGELGVIPPTLLEAMKTPEAKLAKMSPEKRAKRLMQDEAFQSFLRSSLSGGSVMAMFTPQERRYRHGEKIGIDWKKADSVVRHLGRKADRWSWWLRGSAQEHSMQQSWLAAYMVARRGGLDDAAAHKEANLYAMSMSLVGNRASMSPVLNTAPGQALRPMMSWVIAQSSVNWRYLFHDQDRKASLQSGAMGPPGMKRSAKVGAMVATQAATRVAGWFVGAAIVQQIAQLFGFDAVRSLGQGTSEMPVVGNWATWSGHQLQSWLGLAATPDATYKELPEWRQRLVDQAKEHAPDLWREWMIRQAQTAGSMPADIPIFPLWGNWIPYSADTAKTFYQLAKAEFTGDVKNARQQWSKLLYQQLWFMRAYEDGIGSEVDPSDPNMVFVRNPATGVTNVRREKGDWTRVAYNMFGASVQDSTERIERQILQPLRVEKLQAATRSSAFLIGDLHMQSFRAAKQAEQTSDPGAREKLMQVSLEKKAQFMDAVKEYAHEHEMTRPETIAYVKRLRTVAERNYLLTAAERDIVNAYSSDVAFQLMANELNKVPLQDKPAMSKKRWEILQRLWFRGDSRHTSADAMRNSLKGTSKSTRDRFLQAFRTAKQRWAMEAEAESAGIR